MVRDQKIPARGQNPAPGVQARDAALSRISRARRWMIAGGAALTAALAALVSVLLPGKSVGAKRATGTPSAGRAGAAASTGTPRLPAPADASQLGLQGPSATPQAAPAPAPQAAPQPAPAPAPSSGGGAVVSGGS